MRTLSGLRACCAALQLNVSLHGTSTYSQCIPSLSTSPQDPEHPEATMRLRYRLLLLPVACNGAISRLSLTRIEHDVSPRYRKRMHVLTIAKRAALRDRIRFMPPDDQQHSLMNTIPITNVANSQCKPHNVGTQLCLSFDHELIISPGTIRLNEHDLWRASADVLCVCRNDIQPNLGEQCSVH